jgi:hypothetical protein
MADTNINLVEEKKVDPIISRWSRRLRIWAVVIIIVVFFDIAVLAAVRFTLLSKANDLKARREELIRVIEGKKKKEGLYLTLISRLSAIESAVNNNPEMQYLPQLADAVIQDHGRLSSLEADATSLKIEFTAENPRAVERVIDGFRNYKGGQYTFTAFEVEKSEIDTVGIHTVVLNISYNAGL